MKRRFVFISLVFLLCFVFCVIYFVVFASARAASLNKDCLAMETINKSCKKQMVGDVFVSAKIVVVSHLKKHYEIHVYGKTKEKKCVSFFVKKVQILKNRKTLYNTEKEKASPNFILDFEKRYYRAYIVVSKKTWLPFSIFSKLHMVATVSVFCNDGTEITKDVIVPFDTSFYVWFLPTR